MSNEQWLGFQFAGSSVADRSGSRRAVALSIAIHVTFVFMMWAALILLNGAGLNPHLNSIRLPQAVERLVWQKPPVSIASGGGGGDRSLITASRGAAPPPSARKALIVPMLVTNPEAKLQVMPTIDAEAPRLAADEWGDPLATSGILSAGPGKHGIGDGPGGDGSGPVAGTGHGPGGLQAYTLSQVTTQPVLILKIEPEYSERARQAKFQGTVGLRIIIDEKGNPREIMVTRPLGLGLDEKAIEAVSRWRFKPARKNGKPAAVEAFVDVNFRLL